MVAIFALLTQLVNGCRNLMAPAVHWNHDIASARASAAAQGKPMVLFFSADWDAASAEMERKTLVDPDVRTLLHDDFVTARIDCTDEDDPEVTRVERLYGVVGTPSILIVAPDFVTERRRITEFVEPSTLSAALRGAR